MHVFALFVAGEFVPFLCCKICFKKMEVECVNYIASSDPHHDISKQSHAGFYVSLIVSGEGRHTTHLLTCVRLLSTSQTAIF